MFEALSSTASYDTAFSVLNHESVHSRLEELIANGRDHANVEASGEAEVGADGAEEKAADGAGGGTVADRSLLGRSKKAWKRQLDKAEAARSPLGADVTVLGLMNGLHCEGQLAFLGEDMSCALLSAAQRLSAYDDYCTRYTGSQFDLLVMRSAGESYYGVKIEHKVRDGGVHPFKSSSVI